MNAKEIEMSDEDYCEMLNEIFEEVKICGFTFDSGRVFQKLDPIAFRCGKIEQESRWECSECESEFDCQEDAEDCCKVECEECSELFEPVELNSENICLSCEKELKEEKEFDEKIALEDSEEEK